ncbi:hypothetical protein [Aeromonas salmonicida]|uniref:hypothetical protein n=1 Tax=Aeromonas salmonicida TaxID=645 RepID=UPI001114AF23|nr:hypothetical protein [Aeromonas salmonicida]HDO1193684.1 hypothetical protein [Aeromonas salmonicida]
MYYHPKPAASHAAALRPGQLRHVIRVASITGRQPIRDVMLLWLTHSTGVRVTELASIEIRDLARCAMRSICGPLSRSTAALVPST